MLSQHQRLQEHIILAPTASRTRYPLLYQANGYKEQVTHCLPSSNAYMNTEPIAYIAPMALRTQNQLLTIGYRKTYRIHCLPSSNGYKNTEPIAYQLQRLQEHRTNCLPNSNGYKNTEPIAYIAPVALRTQNQLLTIGYRQTYRIHCLPSSKSYKNTEPIAYIGSNGYKNTEPIAYLAPTATRIQNPMLGTYKIRSATTKPT